MLNAAYYLKEITVAFEFWLKNFLVTCNVTIWCIGLLATDGLQGHMKQKPYCFILLMHIYSQLGGLL